MTVSTEDRCVAILRYVHNWRCSRKASVGDLCVQHYRHGARVPSAWEHPINRWGNPTCEPQGPIERRKAAT